jgi:prevent-host-death family protein
MRPHETVPATGAQSYVLHLRSTMKTATVRELRNRYTELLKWLEAGEEITITRRGVAIARLVPANGAKTRRGADWNQSAAFALERLKLRPLTEQQSAELLEENKGLY